MLKDSDFDEIVLHIVPMICCMLHYNCRMLFRLLYFAQLRCRIALLIHCFVMGFVEYSIFLSTVSGVAL